jgi:DnaK suppressor protein
MRVSLHCTHRSVGALFNLEQQRGHSAAVEVAIALPIARGVHNGTAHAVRFLHAADSGREHMTDTIRKAELRQMLTERRSAMQAQVQSRIRDGRTDRHTEVSDDLEHCDADSQGDIELSLLQMRADTLARVDEALLRLDAGKYGRCVECDGEIAERRLRALPFAVRCQACEGRREQDQGRARRRSNVSLFADVTSS